MTQKLVSIGTLAAACLLSPIRTYAAVPTATAAERPAKVVESAQPTLHSDPVEDKFRKLQKEMEGGASSSSQRSGENAGKSSGETQSMPAPRSVGSLTIQILLGSSLC